MNEVEKIKRRKPRPERLLLSRADAAFSLGCSSRTLDYWIKKGMVKAVKLGNKIVRIPVAELKRISEEGLQEPNIDD